VGGSGTPYLGAPGGVWVVGVGALPPLTWVVLGGGRLTTWALALLSGVVLGLGLRRRGGGGPRAHTPCSPCHRQGRCVMCVWGRGPD
jgi:hypothetical protein